MTALQENKLLDCSGMLCPVPVIKTSKAIKEIQPGQILKMVAPDPGAPAPRRTRPRRIGSRWASSRTRATRCRSSRPRRR